MAAPALSCCLSLLVFLLPLAIPQASTSVNGLSISSPDGDRSGGQTLEGHGCPTASPTRRIFTAYASNITCFYNSRANVSCIWSHDGGLQATTCCLHSHQPKREELFPTKQWKHTCELQPVKPGSWACNLVLGPSPEAQKLTIVDVMKLTVMCSEGGKWRKMMTQDIKPFDYIRLVPPHSLQVIHIETHRCNITWTISQVSHYIQNDVEFETRLRYADHSWEDAPLLTLRQNQQWISLENLTPGMEYELQYPVVLCGEGNGNRLQYSCLENPLDRETWWAAVCGITQSRTRLKRLSMHACVGEGNGSPLQYSCLENPRDRGAWWAAVYGVAQSRIRLK